MATPSTCSPGSLSGPCVAVRPEAGGSTRYELLETLREYGRTCLSDAQAADLFGAHSRHFAAEAGTIEAELGGPEEGKAIARAESSLADLRAAQRFALELGELDVAFRLISSIREFAMRAMRYEVFAWADVACNAPGALDHPLAPTLTGMRAYGAWVRGEFELAIQLRRRRAGSRTSYRSSPAVWRNEPLATCSTSWVTW